MKIEDLEQLKIEELKQLVARDIVNGMLLEDVPNTWKTSISTLKSWESDEYYQTCITLAEICKKKNTPIYPPWEILKKRFDPKFLKTKISPFK